MRARIAVASAGLSLLWAGAASACSPALHLAADRAAAGDLLGYGISCTPPGSHFWVFADRTSVADGETGPDGVLGRFVVPDLGAAHQAAVSVYVSSPALAGGHAVDSLPFRYAPAAAPAPPPAPAPGRAHAPAPPPAHRPAPHPPVATHPARSGVLAARGSHVAPQRVVRHARTRRRATALRRARARIRKLSKRLHRLANYLVRSRKTPAARAAKRVEAQARARERRLARAARARRVAPPPRRATLVPSSHRAPHARSGAPLVLLFLALPALILVLLTAAAGRRRGRRAAARA